VHVRAPQRGERGRGGARRTEIEKGKILDNPPPKIFPAVRGEKDGGVGAQMFAARLESSARGSGLCFHDEGLGVGDSCRALVEEEAMCV